MNLFQRIKGSLMGAPLILFSIGLVFFGVGAGLTYSQILFQQQSLQAPGKVISLTENCGDDGCSYSPVVQFTTHSGETAYYHSSFSSSPPEYDIGEAVAIFYKPENPEKAVIVGEGGIFRYVFMGVGGMLLLAGLAFFAANLKNSYINEG